MRQVVDDSEGSALRAMFDQHAAPLFGFALRLTNGDRGSAEDVVQETLVRAWKHRATLTADPGSARPWLYTVARRVAIDEHRRRSARVLETGGEAGERALMSVAAIADVEAGLDRIVIVDAMSALSAEHREVLMQTYYAGRTVSEAAELLGIPTGTVKSRTFYALKALRLALIERGVAL